MQITETVVEILVIRHGETDWNKEQRLQGHLDIALNAEGQRQAQALASWLAQESLDAIFSSDMQRTQQTAAPLAKVSGITVQLDAGLRERCYGALEGLRRPEIKSRFPSAYAALDQRDVDTRYPASAPPDTRIAETLNEFFQRTTAALHRIVDLAKSQQPQQTHLRLAIITHGGVLDCYYRYAHNIPLVRHRDFDIFNASINRMAWDGRQLRIAGWGDVEHLQAQSLDEVDR